MIFNCRPFSYDICRPYNTHNCSQHIQLVFCVWEELSYQALYPHMPQNKRLCTTLSGVTFSQLNPVHQTTYRASHIFLAFSFSVLKIKSPGFPFYLVFFSISNSSSKKQYFKSESKKIKKAWVWSQPTGCGWMFVLADTVFWSAPVVSNLGTESVHWGNLIRYAVDLSGRGERLDL